jgi:hypothetical protein
MNCGTWDTETVFVFWHLWLVSCYFSQALHKIQTPEKYALLGVALTPW